MIVESTVRLTPARRKLTGVAPQPLTKARVGSDLLQKTARETYRATMVLTSQEDMEAKQVLPESEICRGGVRLPRVKASIAAPLAVQPSSVLSRWLRNRHEL